MGLINLRNALMAGKRLPYDAEVEYLESTGTQWIDTRVNAKQSLKIRAVFETNSTSPSYFAYGVRAGNSTITCASGSGQVLGYVRWGTSSYAPAVTGGLVDIAQDSSGVIVNGTSYSYNATQTVVEQSGYTMVLFAGRNSATTVTANMVGKFYSCKIWDNGVLVRDFIPVRKGTVGYLYDRVSGKLFGNAGSGDFVVGPDVVPVEWLGSDGNQYIDTGYVFQFGDDVAATFQPLATPTQTAYFFGADTAYNAGLNVHYDPTWGSTGVRFCYGGGFGDNLGVIMSPAQVFSTSTIYTCNGNTNKRTINSCENTASVQDSGLNSASVILFCARRNADVRPASAGWAVASRFYGFGATRNGADIRAMKPVRVGTEGAMMDTLTRRIYRNAGTGAFGYGNDLKYPIPAE